MNDLPRTDPAVRDDDQAARADAGWASAPPAGPDQQYGAPNPYAPTNQYGQAPAGPTNQYGQAPAGPTPWYGAAATTVPAKPRPPWFWPVIAVAVGLAALLAGGGAGFAIGHAIGAHQSSSTTQFPGQGSNGFPGRGGGTGTFPGQGSGTDSGMGTGTNGSGTNG
ncbi:hypothetical protein ACLBWP_05420 [Microbacterium sp. M1A1_1b]